MTGGTVAAGALTGVAVGVLALLVAGLALVDAAVAAVAAAVLVAVARSLDSGEDHAWSPAPADEPDGARSAVAVLVWSFAARDGKVSEAAMRQLRRQAARRLAGDGIVLDDGRGHLVLTPDGAATSGQERAVELLGARAWRTLTAPGEPPSLAEVAHCIDAVERLPGPAGDARRGAAPTGGRP